ncbi:hypothetical protein U8P73_14865 [Rhizobium beringeri]|uniref:hypothetical protein n=1 Tax=Rhizobium beringeri TaxID=3019934 RepID=UPI002DDD6FFE|nr:hypothetical protein [Rhizobium beringeri]WSG87333.1 hypothetical protein U8P73_14865 [Rhizobium beringeri]
MPVKSITPVISDLAHDPERLGAVGGRGNFAHQLQRQIFGSHFVEDDADRGALFGNHGPVLLANTGSRREVIKLLDRRRDFDFRRIAKIALGAAGRRELDDALADEIVERIGRSRHVGLLSRA